MTYRPFCRPKIFDSHEDFVPAMILSGFGLMFVIVGIFIAVVAPSFTGALLALILVGGLGTMMFLMGLWIIDINFNPFGWKKCEE